MTKPLLEISKLSLNIANQTILSDINLSLNAGETLALVGESGSGKSMTALSIMRLLPHTAKIISGDIMFDGQSLLSLTEKQMQKMRGNHVGIIFQDSGLSLNPVLSIGKQIGESIYLNQKIRGKALQNKVIDLLREVQFPDPESRLSWYPHQLSGGQKQRVVIATALACEPRLLIADEPTTALDVSVQAEILKLFMEIQKKRGISMILITHDMGVVYQTSDYVTVMQAGKIVETAPSKQFFSSPKHAYSKQLLSALPKPGKFLPPLQSREMVLEVTDLSVSFPIRKGFLKRVLGYTDAVQSVSFTVNKQETVAVVGESGSGKTTLGKSILRLLDNDAKITGDVNYQEQSISKITQEKYRPLRQYMQIIFQDPYSSLNPRLSIMQTLSEGMLALGLQNKLKECRPDCEQLMSSVGLSPDMLERYPHEFSGGQRQRIAIARALSVSPQIIVCDEPTSSLDISIRVQIIQLLLRLQKERHLSLLFITHDLSLVPLVAHRVLVMKAGQLIEQGETEQVLCSPSHIYTKKLIDAVPLLHRPSQTSV